MARVTQSIDILAPVEVVWREAADLGSHAEWMADAESVEFMTDQRQGRGTLMQVETVVGPFRLTDLMEVTGWEDHESIAVKHTGLVTGEGIFTLEPSPSGTRFTWTEELSFPWHLGGPITAFFAKPVLGFIWRRNLRGLKRRIEG
jgi:carbon monoxide dehydrogenase subunit G